MADATPAPRRPNRPTSQGPEAGLARELIRTEYRRRNERRRRARGTDFAARAWTALRDAWRDLIGRSRNAPPPSYGADTGLPPDGAAPQARPVPGPPGPGAGPPAGPPLSAGEGRDRALEGIVERIDRLPPDRREAFEDAVLHLLRTDRKWRKAYDEDPAGMPWAARCANNAYEREALREGPALDAAGPARREAPSLGSLAPDAGPPLPDGDALWAAAEDMDRAGERIRAADAVQFAALRERFSRPAAAAREAVPDPPSPSAVLRGPGGHEAVYDGQAFTSIEQASRGASAAGPPPSPLSPPPSPLSPPGGAVEAVSPPSSPVTSPAGPVSPLSSPVPPPARPVSPAHPRAESAAPSLLGPEGLRAARLPATSTTSSPDTRHTGSRPSPAAVQPAAAPVRNRLR